MQVPAPMMPPSELTRLKKIILNGLTNLDLLTDWDRNFLSDFSDKLDKYQRHTFISDKQESQLDRIETYLQEELRDDYD